ncbi:hypothetical protein CRUP_017729 [Coryphaenoides rupestris]|nr:hypothetical protein CRUP_017729 [Coryphaenoides rupestris]
MERTEYSEKFPVYTGLYNPPSVTKPNTQLDKDKKRADMDSITTFKPKEMIRSRDTPKMAVVPTYTEDFKKWEICRQKLTKPESSYQPPTCKFDGTTTVQDDFVPRAAAVRESFKPANAVLQSAAPLESVTSNSLVFVPHPVEPRRQRTPETYKPSGQPLESLTTTRQDFQGLAGELPQSCKPQNNGHFTMARSSVPLQASTESMEKFQKWPVSLPQFQKKEEYVSPTERMSLSTTTAEAYVKHQMQPFVLAKAQLPPKRSTVPFSNHTTTRDDFQSWGVHTRRPIVRGEEMCKSSGKIEDLTTFRAHFTAHELRPSKSFKPPNQHARNVAPMEDSTMYRSEFTPKRISVCPASFELPPGYTFEASDERGHKFFRKMSPRDNNNNNHHLQQQQQQQQPIDNASVPMQSTVAVAS